MLRDRGRLIYADCFVAGNYGLDSNLNIEDARYTRVRRRVSRHTRASSARTGGARSNVDWARFRVAGST